MRRNIPTLKELPIGKITKDITYLYPIFDVHILHKNICKNMRSEGCFSISDVILYVRDNAERLSVHFNLEIQSDHFGNGRSLSIEGCNVY